MIKKPVHLILFGLFLLHSPLFSQVYTTYLWHLQQPIYWPDRSVSDTLTYQRAWESYSLKNSSVNIYSDGLAHPLNDLQEIFAKADRIAVYQSRPKEAVQSLLGLTDAGAQLSYSGCLIENVNSLAAAGQWGYQSGWQNNFTTAHNWTTSDGKPRLDIIGFTMHHALSPLLDERALRMQLAAHQYITQQQFGIAPSPGYWPAECSFSERIIPALVDAGYEWSVIANSHLARTLSDYPLTYGTNGCNYDPPNKADRVNISGSHWWNGQIDGRGGTFAAPYCYQAHKAQYIDPETGETVQMTVVPMADLLSYMNGFGTMGTEEIDVNIAPYADASQPSIILLAHDGDNAWGGGYSYYYESVPGFVSAAVAKGYTPSTIQQFLADNPVPDSDLVHVEDGSWFNAANDWGHPQFINWLWPFIQNNQFNPDGWTEDARNWAVLTAIENIVESAEDLSSPIRIAEVVKPDAGATSAERAWHYLMPGYTSGYMYYGSSLDMEVKQTLAANLAHEQAMKVLDHVSGDKTAPTIFIPQRFPWNPGGEGFGPLFNYQIIQNDTDFFIWTFIYDYSGLASVQLKYRTDYNGQNSTSDNENEIYSGGSGVSDWQSIDMILREFPVANVTGSSDINFFILPHEIANEYYAEISGLADTLVDYYVEAADNAGNVKRSPIQHVYVGENHQGSSSNDYVHFSPENPSVGDTIIIWYSEEGSLFSADPLYIHHGVNNWQTVQDEAMIFDADSNVWHISIVPNQYVSSIDFVFTNMNNVWDNNGGKDWHISVSGGSSPEGFTMDGRLDAAAELVLETSNHHVYAARDDDQFYIAVEPPVQNTNNDLFVFATHSQQTLKAAPWAKSGQIAGWNLYLAREGSNNWCGWSDDAGSASAFSSESLTEGTFSLSVEDFKHPDSVFIALVWYETSDGGQITLNLPGNGGTDNIIDFAEFYHFGDGYRYLTAPDILNPKTFCLYPAYPNPFNTETTLHFDIPENDHITLSIYNLRGQKLLNLLDQSLIAGTYSITMKAAAYSSGIYLVRLEGRHFSDTQKIILLR